MKRKKIIALCILITCFVVPFLTWAESYACWRCGSHNTTTDVYRGAPEYYSPSQHKMHVTICIHCEDCNYGSNTGKPIYESHTFNTTVLRRWTNLNCKQVEYRCRACDYSYKKYMAIDPKKPYTTPQ